MTSDPTTVVPAWASGLGLQPHPEGGWYAETWRSPVEVDPVALPAYPGPRSLATAIYFLLLPGEESAWHRVRSAELWFLHRGALELRLGGEAEDGPDEVERLVLGTDIRAGARPQLLVPAGHWQSARPLGNEAALVSCVVCPGFDFEDFTLLPA
ncbi:MAG: cupin domain-containing protein [Lapillicoccus sp.]